jgi:hypothetical protein
MGKDLGAGVDASSPYTFVKFELQGGGTPGAIIDPVARFKGGPHPDGNYLMSGQSVDFETNEVVGVVFEVANPDYDPTLNGGYYVVNRLGVFRKGIDGMFNGTLQFNDGISKDGLAAAFGDAGSATEGECPYDHVPVADSADAVSSGGAANEDEDGWIELEEGWPEEDAP